MALSNKARWLMKCAFGAPAIATEIADAIDEAALIETAEIDANAVTTAKIAFANVTVDQMAANSVDSAQYVDGSIDLAHMSVNSIDSDQYVDGSIDLAHMSVNSIDSDQYVDGSIDLAHMSVNSIDSDQYVDGSIDLAHMSVNSIDSDQYVDGSIDSAHFSANSVDSSALGPNSVPLYAMQVNSVDSDQYVDGSIDTVHYAANSVDSAAIQQGLLKYVDVTLDYNDILLIDTAPHTILAAPPSGYIHVVDHAAFATVYDTDVWTLTADDLTLEYSGGTDIDADFISNADFVNAGNIVKQMSMDHTTQADLPAAEAIQLKTSAGATVGGGNANNTISIRLWYRTYKEALI